MSDGPGGRPLVVGVGNEIRGDDAVGRRVAQWLRARAIPGVDVEELGQADMGLLERWRGLPIVVVADALRGGRPPGTIVRLEVDGAGVPAELGVTSTHGLSIAQAVALGMALGRMPERLVLYGIEASAFTHGAGLSDAVARSVPVAGARIRAELTGADEGRSAARPGGSPHA